MNATCKQKTYIEKNGINTFVVFILAKFKKKSKNNFKTHDNFKEIDNFNLYYIKREKHLK